MSDTSHVIAVRVDGSLAELVTDRMWQWGVQAVGETALGGGRVEIVTSVGDDPDAIDRAVATLDPQWDVEVRAVDTALQSVAPEHLSPTWYAPGRVSIPAVLAPLEIADGAHDDVLVTVIDPGAAFGLGDHPTTRSTMALLAARIEQPDGAPVTSVLDVGCGTGALAVLAAQLGVPAIRAIDIADAAVEATTRNAEINGVEGRIHVDTAPISHVEGAYDVVVANILAPVLISMADDFRRLLAPGGSLIVSGILAERHDHVLDALAPLRPVTSQRADGWIAIELR